MKPQTFTLKILFQMALALPCQIGTVLKGRTVMDAVAGSVGTGSQGC